MRGQEIKIFIIRNAITGEYNRQWMHTPKVYHKKAHAQVLVTKQKRRLNKLNRMRHDFWKDAEVVECILTIPPLSFYF